MRWDRIIDTLILVMVDGMSDIVTDIPSLWVLTHLQARTLDNVVGNP